MRIAAVIMTRSSHSTRSAAVLSAKGMMDLVVGAIGKTLEVLVNVIKIFLVRS